MALAVLEGVSYSVRLAFDALKISAASDPEIIHIGGGGAGSDLWCQIRADVLGKTLRRCAAPESAALGAAILAGRSQNIGSSLSASVQQLVKFDRSFEPNPGKAGYHAERLGQYLELYRSMLRFNAAF